jgi:hypothetical protein
MNDYFMGSVLVSLLWRGQRQVMVRFWIIDIRKLRALRCSNPCHSGFLSVRRVDMLLISDMSKDSSTVSWSESLACKMRVDSRVLAKVLCHSWQWSRSTPPRIRATAPCLDCLVKVGIHIHALSFCLSGLVLLHPLLHCQPACAAQSSFVPSLPVRHALSPIDEQDALNAGLCGDCNPPGLPNSSRH